MNDHVRDLLRDHAIVLGDERLAYYVATRIVDDLPIKGRTISDKAAIRLSMRIAAAAHLLGRITVTSTVAMRRAIEQEVTVVMRDRGFDLKGKHVVADKAVVSLYDDVTSFGRTIARTERVVGQPLASRHFAYGIETVGLISGYTDTTTVKDRMLSGDVYQQAEALHGAYEALLALVSSPYPMTLREDVTTGRRAVLSVLWNVDELLPAAKAN